MTLGIFHDKSPVDHVHVSMGRRSNSQPLDQQSDSLLIALWELDTQYLYYVHNTLVYTSEETFYLKGR